MRDYFARAIADARVIEVRHFDGTRITSGLFNDAGALGSTLAKLAERGNSYTTLNAPREARASNAMTGAALSDEDIATIVRLPFDFDAVRPKGVPSTEGEVEATKAALNHFVRVFSALGWPAPACATSGNGSHALYRCRLPVTAETREMLTTLYRGLQAEFSTPQAQFDPSVRNPSRIWRAYGTINRKGEASGERPHRRAAIIIPPRWEGVSLRQVEAAANHYARIRAPREHAAERIIMHELAQGRGDYASLDVVGWFTAHDLYKRSLGGGKHSVACPWLAEHSTNDSQHSTGSVIWEGEAGRWPSFHCSHAHCDRRSLLDVMRLWGDADRHCRRAWRSQTRSERLRTMFPVT